MELIKKGDDKGEWLVSQETMDRFRRVMGRDNLYGSKMLRVNDKYESEEVLDFLAYKEARYLL
jgi:hypothetical protein